MSDPLGILLRGMKEKVIIRVVLEPGLEEIAGHLSPDEREFVARRYYRWSKQLWATARALRPLPLPRAAPPRKARPL